MMLLLRRGLVAGFVLCLVMPGLVHAQIPVTDVGNLVQNTLQVAESVLMVANMIKELLPLAEIVIGDDFQNDVSALGAVVQEAQGLAYDLGSLQQQVTTLFSLDSAPRNTRDLQVRLAAIRRVVFDSYVYALRTQTLIKTVLSTIRHLTRLVTAIGNFVGNNQGNQTLAQLEATMNHHLATLQVQTAAFERAQSVERLAEPLTVESIQRINEAVMADYPK